MRLSTLITLFFCSSSFAQKSNYQNLLDTASRGALFIHSRPLNNLRLDKGDLWFYADNLREWSRQTLDTVMFLQIIQNAKEPDTTLWSDGEFPFALLVNSRAEIVSKRYAIQKFSLTDKMQIRFYNKRISQFNATVAFNRNINYFSRPVFDDSKTFAVIKWDNGHSGLGGGGGIILYHLEGDSWKEVGIIMNWKN